MSDGRLVRFRDRVRTAWRRVRTFREFVGITIGVLVTALGLDVFLVPNRLAAGGVSGLATVAHYRLGLPVGLTMALLNVLLFALATGVYGWRYGAKTVYGAFALSFAVDLLAPIAPTLPGEPFLGTLYGGILTGIGVGIVFRSGGNTGGTDIIVQLLQKYVNLGVGQLFLLVDTSVMLVAASAFGAKLALYGMIAVIIGGRVIDFVQEGLVVAKAAFIISERSDEVAAAILGELKRGATALSSRGLFTGKFRETILCVVSRRELPALKSVVYRVDPSAFIVVTDASEVVGEGFKELIA